MNKEQKIVLAMGIALDASDATKSWIGYASEGEIKAELDTNRDEFVKQDIWCALERFQVGRVEVHPDDMDYITKLATKFHKSNIDLLSEEYGVRVERTVRFLGEGLPAQHIRTWLTDDLLRRQLDRHHNLITLMENAPIEDIESGLISVVSYDFVEFLISQGLATEVELDMFCMDVSVEAMK